VAQSTYTFACAGLGGWAVRHPPTHPGHTRALEKWTRNRPRRAPHVARNSSCRADSELGGTATLARSFQHPLPVSAQHLEGLVLVLLCLTGIFSLTLGVHMARTSSGVIGRRCGSARTGLGPDPRAASEAVITFRQLYMPIDVGELDVEDQVRVRWHEARKAALAVGEVRGDHDPRLPSQANLLNALVEPRDHLSLANSETERLPSPRPSGGVPLFSVDYEGVIVDGDQLSRMGKVDSVT
jgi:hypothetical protein